MFTSIVVELRKTPKVKRHFNYLKLTNEEWEGARVLWFSPKVYDVTKVEELHRSKDWNMLSTSKSRQPYLKVKPIFSMSIARPDEIDAYFAREAEIRRLSANRTGLLAFHTVEQTHRVYAFMFNNDIIANQAFLKKNPKLKSRPLTLVYIGMTSKSLEERHHQHCYAPTEGSKDLGSPKMRRFGVRDFPKANMTQALLNDPKVPVENLTNAEARWAERYYGEHLKSPSCGTWYN
jgi:hypothetical protein